MAAYYLDTSAFVKLFVNEQGTDTMLKMLSDENNNFVLLSITRVEFRSALRRRERDGDISAADFRAIETHLAKNLAARFVFQPVSDQVLEYALSLLDTHPLRAYDAVQLAGCQTLSQFAQSPVFVCSDKELLDAAKTEGFEVVNPEQAA